MGHVIRGAVISTCAILGGVVARDAVTHERKAAAKCAEHLDDAQSDVELLPFNCMPYGFEMTDTVNEDGELVSRVHHMPARADFLSKYERELNPTLKYIIYSLGAAAVPCLLYVGLSDGRRRDCSQ